MPSRARTEAYPIDLISKGQALNIIQSPRRVRGSYDFSPDTLDIFRDTGLLLATETILPATSEHPRRRVFRYIRGYAVGLSAALEENQSKKSTWRAVAQAYGQASSEAVLNTKRAFDEAIVDNTLLDSRGEPYVNSVTAAELTGFGGRILVSRLGGYAIDGEISQGYAIPVQNIAEHITWKHQAFEPPAA